MSEKKTPLFTTNEWTPELIDITAQHIHRIGTKKLGLDFYPNQIEIISSEQMLDAYSSVGMPVMYDHWSYGKSFLSNWNMYNRGIMGLAYEIVINSNPCIAYCMEDNTMTMQALVIAHACIGHNSFFKCNYLFNQWTNAESIIDYLVFAKRYIANCEERYGVSEVESVIDSCHALQDYGVDRYKRSGSLSLKDEEAREHERAEYAQQQVNDLWENTIPRALKSESDEIPRFPKEPHENILYFVEKNAPLMPQWKREIVRIIRKISQYFYPQRQTQLMNEGWATFIHHTIIHEMYDEGLLTDGSMIEFMKSHSSVIWQPGFNSKYFNGINVYALGFAMFQDIKRICMEPTEEDLKWFPSWAGNGDWLTTCKEAMMNYKDESFILQFLSPKLIRDFKLFVLEDDDREEEMEIVAIHNERGYQQVREALSNDFRLTNREPNIQVYEVDISGSRAITLQHIMHDRKPLHVEETLMTLEHLRNLWGFDVKLESIDPTTNETMYEFTVTEDDALFDTYV